MPLYLKGKYLWLQSVDQSTDPSASRGDLYERPEKKRLKSFKQGGRAYDGCSPEVCVDTLVVGSAGYFVVLSAGLFLLHECEQESLILVIHYI